MLKNIAVQNGLMKETGKHRLNPRELKLLAQPKFPLRVRVGDAFNFEKLKYRRCKAVMLKELLQRFDDSN